MIGLVTVVNLNRRDHVAAGKNVGESIETVTVIGEYLWDYNVVHWKLFVTYKGDPSEDS